MILAEATKPASEKRVCNCSPVIWWGRLVTDNLLLITLSLPVLRGSIYLRLLCSRPGAEQFGSRDGDGAPVGLFESPLHHPGRKRGLPAQSPPLKRAPEQS